MTPFLGGRAWIEVSRSALAHNVAYLRSHLPETCRLMPAVKANGYGHGGVLVARALNELGVDAFCVASVQEGVELRQQGIFGEILVLGCTQPEDFPLLCKWDLIQTVVDYPYARSLHAYGRPMAVHIAVDTGMHRLGERSDHMAEILKIYELENLRVKGLYTHLCVSDSLDPEALSYTKMQAEAFDSVVAAVKAGAIRSQSFICRPATGCLCTRSSRATMPGWALPCTGCSPQRRIPPAGAETFVRCCPSRPGWPPSAPYIKARAPATACATPPPRTAKLPPLPSAMPTAFPEACPAEKEPC